MTDALVALSPDIIGLPVRLAVFQFRDFDILAEAVADGHGVVEPEPSRERGAPLLGEDSAAVPIELGIASDEQDCPEDAGVLR